MKHLYSLLTLSLLLLYGCEKTYPPPPDRPYVYRPQTDTADWLCFDIDTTLLLNDTNSKITDYLFAHLKPEPFTMRNFKGAFRLTSRAPQEHTYKLEYAGTDKFAITRLHTVEPGYISFSYNYGIALNRTLFLAYEQGTMKNVYFTPYDWIDISIYYNSKDTSRPDQVVEALNRLLQKKDTTLLRKTH
jgi:hypothetical protein